MVCIFIPLVYGCPTSIVQDGSDTRICPRCHNASVLPCKTKKRFELFWIPLIPLGTKEIWFSNVCQWSTPVIGAFQPSTLNGLPPTPYGGKRQLEQTPKGYVPPAGRGYDVGYAAPGNAVGPKVG